VDGPPVDPPIVACPQESIRGIQNRLGCVEPVLDCSSAVHLAEHRPDPLELLLFLLLDAVELDQVEDRMSFSSGASAMR
jgi:hypothetical protein